MQTKLPKHDVVLLGIGHTNAHVLRMWRMQPPRDVRLTCVSNFSVATYSGMLPGVLAGQYPTERMEIDLVRLCAANGARFIRGEVTGLDVAERRLLLADRPPLPFDVLSIGIGSVPSMEGLIHQDETLLPIKPMQTFVARLEERLTAVAASRTDGPIRAAIVGAGAGGVEIAFCLPARVKKLLGDMSLEVTLINGSDNIVAGASAKTVARVKEELKSRGVNLTFGRRAVEVCCGRVKLDDGEVIEADIVLWATGATAPPLLEKFDLPKDDRGFLLTYTTLKTTADAPIFAVGDTGTIAGVDRPKAGVFAVRQGPVLWRNIDSLLRGEPFEPYRPQEKFLKLLNLGDGRAIAEYGSVTAAGRWAWKLKDAIDGKFMDKYQDYSPMEMSPSVPSPDDPINQMRCAGCGGKVAGSVLSRVLARLDVPASEHVLVGLDQPDDAAILRSPGGRPMTVTADFFAAPLDDPYITGRIAALNAASDVFAIGGSPLAALALVSMPVGRERQQEELLYQLLAGSLHEFRQMGATLIGGHTIEGPQLTIGFTVLADQGDDDPQTKGRLQAGDALVLTKPLGSGVLLAAHMQAACQADWYDALLPAMLASNQHPAEAAQEFPITGLTDVTGFGLAGHLLEMLGAADVRAELSLDALPLLPGAAELIADGVESTLAPANRAAEQEIAASESLRDQAAYKVLFDPQTCGGLLIGVASERADDLVLHLEEKTGQPAVVIGRVISPDSSKQRISVSNGNPG